MGKYVKYCFAGFCMFMSTLAASSGNDGEPTNTNWFSGNTITIIVNPANSASN